MDREALVEIGPDGLEPWRAALADLAEVPDWAPVWGPDAIGDELLRLRYRVAAATGWTPMPAGAVVDDRQRSWGFTTGRRTVLDVFPQVVLVRGGWIIRDVRDEEEYWQAVAAVIPRWEALVEYAAELLGQETRPGVWTRPGAEIRLARVMPEQFDEDEPGIAFSLSVAATR